MAKPYRALTRYPIRTAVSRAEQLILNRMKGENMPLIIPFPRMNVTLEKVELDSIFTLAGLSGGGKTTVIAEITNSLQKLNPKQKMHIVDFNFEMTDQATIIRELTKRTGIPSKRIKSTFEVLSDDELEIVRASLREIEKEDVSIVPEPGDGYTIAKNIVDIWRAECKEEDKILIYKIDHTLIVDEQEDRPGDLAKIDWLMRNINIAKKRISFEGGKSVGFILSQMNRSIRDEKRLSKPTMHFPMTSDIFGSSSVEYYSDYIVILNAPDKLYLDSYGPEDYPVNYTDNGVKKYFIYAHLIKNRHASLNESVIPFWNNFETASIEEIDKNEFQAIMKQGIGGDIKKEEYYGKAKEELEQY